MSQQCYTCHVSSLRTVAAPRPWPRRWIVVAGVLNFMCYIFTYNGTEGTHRYYFARDKYTASKLQTKPREDFTIKEKPATMALSWMKALASTFIFKTLCLMGA